MISYDPEQDAYAILGVHPEADKKEVEAAYRKAALTWHPDKSPAPDAGERFQEVLAAAHILRSPRQRRLYDLARADWRKRHGFSERPPRTKRPPKYEAPKGGEGLPPPPEWLASSIKVFYDSVHVKLQTPPRAGRGSVLLYFAAFGLLGGAVAKGDLRLLGLALVLFAIGRVMRVPPHEGVLSWAKLTPARRIAEFHLLDQRAARYEKFTIPYQLLKIVVADHGRQYRIEIAGFPRATTPVLFETYSRTEARRLAREAGDYFSIPLAA
ncbi:MAG: J domain-containing protein [Planctomycetota bacterium]